LRDRFVSEENDKERQKENGKTQYFDEAGHEALLENHARN